MESLLESIKDLPACQLQRVAAQAARCGDPLTAMRMLHALAVRCARDYDALMHVCTALHLHNDFCTLYSLLHCCYDFDDFFALFAEAQRAYGTRVFSGVTCNDEQRCVCVVTLYRVYVFRVNGEGVVSVVSDVNLCVLPPRAIAHIEKLRALPMPSKALEEQMLYPAFQRVIPALDAPIPPTAEGAREELDQVSELHRTPTSSHTALTLCSIGSLYIHLRGACGWLKRLRTILWDQ
jgi:hypothetical protein